MPVEREPTKRAKGTALITGASSGIGLELAKVFAREGHELVLVARRQELLEQLAEEISDEHRSDERDGPKVFARDLATPGAAAELHATLKADDLEIDVLVNNAGVMEDGPFLESDPSRLSNLMALNVVALAELTRLLLPLMVGRGRGKLLNVASLASFQPIPHLALYAASKAFVLSLTESLSEELAGTGVTATALCPGLTDTSLVSGALGGDVPSYLLMDAKSVARAGYRAMKAGRVIEVPGVANEAAANWSRALPRWMVRMMGGVAARSGRGFGKADS